MDVEINVDVKWGVCVCVCAHIFCVHVCTYILCHLNSNEHLLASKDYFPLKGTEAPLING